MNKKALLCLGIFFGFLAGIKAQCTGIDFTVPATNGCSPFIVKFTARNYPVNSSFSWDFGLGYSTQSSADSFKVNVFSSPGTYTASLKVFLPGGAICNIVKTNFIVVGNKPVPSFSYNKTVLCKGGDTVTFTDLSPSSVSRDWIIDGALYNNGPRVLKHYVSISGFKSVSIRIRDAFGCEGVLNKDSAIRVMDIPNVDFIASDTGGCAPLNIAYIPLITGLNGQVVTNYSWSLPGTIPNGGTASNPIVTYTNAGTYSATLTITTNLGCTYSGTKSAYIKMGSAIPLTFRAQADTLCYPALVKLSNTTVGLPVPGTFGWKVDTGSIVSSNADSSIIFVKYYTPGQYGATMTYTNRGCVSVKKIFPVVTLLGPIANFYSLDRVNCFIPDTVVMVNYSTIPTTGVTTFKWTVYDSNKTSEMFTSTLKDPIFIINKFGRFDVKLVVSNTNGCKDSIRYNEFLVVDTAIARMDAVPRNACVGQLINFADNTQPFSTKAPIKYYWIFYDLDSVTILKTDTIGSPNITYFKPGKYNVRFIVYNKYGCGDTLDAKEFITVGTPVAGFNVTDTMICENSIIMFTENTFPKIGTMNHSWFVQHTDSANLNYSDTMVGQFAQFPVRFTVPGMYNVIYRAFNPGSGCRDSIIKNGYIKVNGIKGKLISNKKSVCEPGTVTVSGNTVYNFHFKNPSATVSYYWSVDTAGNGSKLNSYTIADPLSQSTLISFTKRGTYKVYCKFGNSDGCEYLDSNDALTINVGIVAGFSMDTSYCIYDSAAPVDTSKLSPSGYNWISDASVHFWPTDTIINPKITFTATGPHTIIMVAKTSDGCNDTSKIKIKVYKPLADFTSDDSINICSPALVHFRNKASPDSSLYLWDFGDGSPPLSTHDTSVAHFFYIQNGISDFTVRLVTINKFGCHDTMTKKDFVRFVGPVPYFKMYNNKGCDPLRVHIVDSSRNVYRFYFSYGIGPVDSVSITDKTYSLAGSAALYSVYKPYLYVFDNSGSCTQFYQPSDSIVVYRSPKAYFYTTSTAGCAPFTTDFMDTSFGAVKWYWDFNSDGIIDDTARNPTYTFVQPGKYTVRLVIKNQFGCTDTISVTDLIESYPKPLADFTITDTLVCPGSVVKFTNNTLSALPVKKYHWDFGVPGLQSDTSVLASPAYMFQIPGIYDVKLVVENIQGCIDSIIRPGLIRVKDNQPPEQPEIYYVTVQNDHDIKIVWNKNNSPDFRSSNLERDAGGGFTSVSVNSKGDDSVFTDNSGINVKTQSYSYRIDADDSCNFKTSKSKVHRSIYLDATTNSQNSNLVTWNSYSGWPAGSYRYQVYRSSAYGGPYFLHANFKTGDTAFVDLQLCDTGYYYYVEAIQSVTGFVSRSNIDFNRPPFFKPVVPAELVRATVINDRDILVEWDTVSASTDNKESFSIDRLDPTGALINLGTSNSNFFIDRNVDVHARNYTYRVQMKDYCGNTSPESNIGRSIYLTVTREDEINYAERLAWTSYGYWSNSVQSYEVEYYDPRTGVYQVIALVPGTDTSYLDKRFHKTDSASFCYRVKAIEAVQPVPDTSVSNMACVMLPPRLYIPNAFSPNNDGVNDVFYAQGVFLQNLTGHPLVDYSLKIYDRWGGLVFESDDIHKGWDGTIDGVLAEIGVYIYDVHAMGFNKQRFNYRGTLQLIR
jgi:gliding motility-associated-like protein